MIKLTAPKMTIISLLILAFSCQAFAEGTITKSKSTYAIEEPIELTLSGLSGDRDWVGIYHEGDSNAWGNVVSWKWANSDSVSLAGIPDSGSYEARLFYHNSYNVQAFDTFFVGDNEAMIDSSRPSYKTNEQIHLTVEGLSGDRDWVGIYRKNDSNAWANVIRWSWANDNKITINGIPDKGEYEARLFFHNSYTVEDSVELDVLNNTKQDVIIGARPVKSTPINKGKLFASPGGHGNCLSYAGACDLHKAIAKLSKTNNVLFLSGGTYHLNSRIYFGSKSGTISKPLTIEGIDPDNKPILTGDFGKALIKVYKSRYIQFRNLEIKDFSGFGIRIRNASNITVEGCIIHDNKASGISLYKSHNNIIIDNISYNNIDDNLGNADGIQIELGGVTSYDNKIIHNTVSNNSDDGIDTFGGINTTIAYNISYGNMGAEGLNGGPGNGIGIKACSASSKGSIVEHNIVFGNNGNGIECQNNTGEDVVFKYNTAYANKGSGFGLPSYSQVNLSNNISSDNDVPQNLYGIQRNNSWDINNNVPFINTDYHLKNFLKPKHGSGFENMGVYAP